MRASGADLAVVVVTALGSEEVAVGALRRRRGQLPAVGRSGARRSWRCRNASCRARRIGARNEALQRQLDDEHRRLEHELARAVQVQGDLLPWVAPALAGLDLAARCPPVLPEATSRSGAVTLEPGDALVCTATAGWTPAPAPPSVRPHSPPRPGGPAPPPSWSTATGV